MQYTNSAKCNVKEASLVQLLSWPLFDWSISAPAFPIHQHPTQVFHILPLERFDSVGKHFYIESAQEGQIISSKCTSGAVSLHCYTQHEWSQEYMFGFQEQDWKTLVVILETKWTQFLRQGQYKKKKKKKWTKSKKMLHMTEVKNCYTIYITGDGRA